MHDGIRPGMATTINLGQALTDIRTMLATIARLRARVEWLEEGIGILEGDYHDASTFDWHAREPEAAP